MSDRVGHGEEKPFIWSIPAEVESIKIKPHERRLGPFNR
jgi:hypothetical protein